MRVGALLAGLGAVVTFAVAFPGAATAQTAGQDSVVGSGSTLDDLFVGLDARSGPSGENPTGTGAAGLLSQVQIRVEGDVTCLTVTGNRAVVGIDNSRGSSLLGRGAFIEVIDGGTVDTVSVLTMLQEVPMVCPLALELPPRQVFGRGFVVHDAQPFPTSKDQCKNGGWRNFPGFKNQGDCVSFVATGGKNPPADYAAGGGVQ
jgi:hypothetical protein